LVWKLREKIDETKGFFGETCYGRNDPDEETQEKDFFGGTYYERRSRYGKRDVLRGCL
jgi:hypothetical protein